MKKGKLIGIEMNNFLLDRNLELENVRVKEIEAIES